MNPSSPPEAWEFPHIKKWWQDNMTTWCESIALDIPYCHIMSMWWYDIRTQRDHAVTLSCAGKANVPQGLYVCPPRYDNITRWWNGDLMASSNHMPIMWQYVHKAIWSHHGVMSSCHRIFMCANSGVKPLKGTKTNWANFFLVWGERLFVWGKSKYLAVPFSEALVKAL